MKTPRHLLTTLPLATAAILFAACQSGTAGNPGQNEAKRDTAGVPNATNLKRTELARFNEPWAMTFLPDGRLLVTEKKGNLRLFDPVTGKTGNISGTPSVAYGGQGGLGDIALHPDFANNPMVYLSFAESGGNGTQGAAIMRAKLDLDDQGNGQLSDVEVIWRQVPKVEGEGHYSHRIVFAPDGKMFVTSGERQKFTPAQDMKANLGKVLRLNDDGTSPADNPFFAQGGVATQVWSLGHRNLLGLAFNPADGKLYEHEMGPRGGDEFNVIERGKNYGYPVVSDGDHYSGKSIPDHKTRPEFRAPLMTWTPVISPSSLMFYTGKRIPQWTGDALISGLSSEALIRVKVENGHAREVERIDMGERIRDVVQAPDESVWALEDGSNAKLLRLAP